AVTWTVQGGNPNGTISPTGLYTAPFVAGTYTVVATSVGDPAHSATLQLTVPAVNVQVNPDTASVAVNTTASFTAMVSGLANTAVTWSVAANG
ncbi:hypothetical protein ABTN33_19410, partial [Acinetobacter baumannii]